MHKMDLEKVADDINKGEGYGVCRYLHRKTGDREREYQILGDSHQGPDMGFTSQRHGMGRK